MTWTEILHIAGPALSFAAVVVGFVTWLFTRHIRSLDRQFRRAEAERDDVKERLRRAQASLERLAEYRSLYRDLRERNEELGEAQATSELVKAKLKKRLESAQADAKKVRAVLLQWQRFKLASDKKRQALNDSTARDTARIEQLTTELEERQKALAELEAQVEKEQEQLRQFETEVETKNSALEQVKKERFELKEQLTALEGQLEGAVEQNGRVWERPMAADAPAFVPIGPRKTPIISFINLKGGVGKTTLSANVGAMLGLHGKRVLLIDLDYQRSLSMMCCSHDQIKELHQGGRCLQHYLLDKSPSASKLLSCMFPVRTASHCEIVTVSEAKDATDAAATLEDAEMRLMARWLLGQGPEVRTHLRAALHSPLVHERFDYVLLDCPPRFSTACINALAASDFALVPVMLDRTSAISAANLLRKLNRLHYTGVMPNLKVLGIVANGVRLYGGALISSQATVWEDIALPCEVAWGERPYFFNAKIKHSPAVAEAAERHDQQKSTGTFAAFLDDLKPLFTDLIEEIQERIAHERSRLTAVPA
jgi:cellulose biosynthesis protein BcsQ